MPFNKNNNRTYSSDEEEDDLEPNPNRPLTPSSPSPSSSPSPTSNTPTLLITSFAHRRGPLQPTPTLLIDLRTLPNPPKDLRSTQTGLSKSLRGWLSQNSEFKKRFEDACSKIEGVLKEREDTLLKKEKEREAKGRKGNNEDDGEEEEDEMQVSIGVRCEMGRHRSVAFVEELSRHAWPAGWKVIVHHRDVDIERTRESMKGPGRRGRGKVAYMDEEDE
ncbi:hypothetical protein BDQ17DRAFT_1310107 [Cyathus striatus]|nr:hypothetical protein BDQ17DRAFT_1310107 [Cyathus striatus]